MQKMGDQTMNRVRGGIALGLVTSGRLAVSSLALGFLIILGCATTIERPEPQFWLGPENRPFLLSPLSGYPRGVAPITTHQLESGFRALVRDGDISSAYQVSQSLLDLNPSLHPAQLLEAQVGFLQGNYAALADKVDEIVIEVPDYLAALVLRARVAELLEDIPRAFELYSAVRKIHSVSDHKAIGLRDRALVKTRQEIQDALSVGHLAAAAKRVKKLRTWAPGEVSTLEIQQAVAIALEDPVAELAALRGLSTLAPGDSARMNRRAVLETEVGDVGLGLGILQRLVNQYPEDVELGENLGKARFRWRMMVLPEAVRELADVEVLKRGDFAALLYWLFPEIRYGKPVTARIANDILGHAFRDEIVKVANLGLVEVDPSLHQFNPDLDLTRGTAFRSFLALLEGAVEEPACLGNWRQSLNPSVEFVCQAAASCGLIPDPADCLPTSTVSGQVVVEMGRLAQSQLGGR